MCKFVARLRKACGRGHRSATRETRVFDFTAAAERSRLQAGTLPRGFTLAALSHERER